jgi:ParB family chromosome partitioning protein
MEKISIHKITPAEYNPRFLSDTAFSELKKSISDLGFILPIIVNKDNNRIVAGHQRTKSCAELGIDEVPVKYIKNISITDEVSYNQLHNGMEIEPKAKGRCLVEGDGFCEIDSKKFLLHESKAAVVNVICRLYHQYGDALCAIVCNGEVVMGNNYVKACQILGIPVFCSFIEKEKYEILNYYLFNDYGVFCYDRIERNDFVQGLAQPNRYGAIEWSVLYQKAIKYILNEDKNINILDFGCGKGLFINRIIKDNGFRNAIGLEFFNHNKKGIDIAEGHRQIDKFIEHVKKHGKFDVVICDAVINSVNSQAAEDSVLACLSLFAKEKTGKIFVSGRSRDAIEMSMQNTKRASKHDNVIIKFFDDSGLTSILREGKWFFQKFLYKHQVDVIIQKFDDSSFMRYDKNYFGFGVLNNKSRTKEEYINAVNYEFNLNLPNRKSYNRHEEVIKLFGLDK